ncbi:response regulator [Terrimonas sp. NA20]|uniref:histidine kinase n=1 Tax=Terrimonas ginsenosidimutans TaxID=2908004 RepID=A0ABS9KLM9_9BACT|nr:two-component regulator propeller domain-containing protein [Terrimonas ginsenosidimutans]MCG2613214.1 response regulator [Terrimonas ginsenosidimutans]
MLLKKNILLLVLLLAGITGFCNRFPVRTLGIDAGLSNNAVTCIYQDQRGFMWFGTYDGLNRYNGYNFDVFRNKIGDSTSLLTNSVYSIDGDPLRRIWVGGQKGACLFDPSKSAFESVYYYSADRKQLSPVKDNVHVVRSVGDRMLIGTNHSGLLVFEAGAKTGKQISLPGTAANQTTYDVTAIEAGADGSVWIFIQQQGVFKYNTRTGQLALVNDHIKQANCFKRSSAGTLWVGNEKGLYRYDGKNNQYSSSYLATPCKVVSISEDSKGILWIASDGGGLLFLDQSSPEAKTFTDLDGRSPINSNAVYSIYEDKDGRKWIGTLRGGINIIEPHVERFRQVSYMKAGPADAADNFILSFCEDRTGNLWIGTDGAGLKYWNRKANSFQEYRRQPSVPGSLSSNFITNIFCDENDHTWVSTWFGGVSRFDPATKQFKQYRLFNDKTGEAENNVWVLYEDKQKRLWAGATNDGSLYYYEPAKDQFVLFDDKVQNLQCIAEDSKGELWGGNYAELIRVDRVQKKHRVYSVGYTIRSIHEDAAHNFWVGTQEGGLLLFDRNTGHYEQFTTNEGLPNNTILRILEDKKGHLWLSTYNGLSRFDIKTRTFRNYSRLDGLQNNQFSFNAALELRNGEFAFGGIHGFNLFYPDSVRDESVSPPIFLTGLTIDGRTAGEVPRYITGRENENIRKVKLPYDRAVVTLDFLALAYADADKISYAYLLEGWDKNWNNVNSIRTANYSRLQEGNYSFYVKIKKPDGKWSDPELLLEITVLPPWYRTWWAYTLYLLAAALAIYLYIRYTKRQERLRYEIKLAHIENEKDRELTEKKLSFFTNVAHEFRTPVSLIINPLREIIQGRQPEKDKQELNIVYRNARRLLSLVDQLLLFRKADSGADVLKISRLNVTDICNEVFQCFVQQAKTKNIRFEFVVPEQPLEIYGDNEKLEIVLFNLFSNAFKYTPSGGTIQCRVEDTADGVVIRVLDTGCGIGKEDAARVFERFQQASARAPKTGFGIGLYLSKAFIESHGGTITLNSVPGKGSEFVITLKKGKTHLPEDYILFTNENEHQLLGELIEEQVPVVNVTKSPEAPLSEELVTDKKTILVVDDNIEMREYLQHIFNQNYIIFTAPNGLEGFEQAGHHMPDLIISDVNMDGIDGLELCRRLKRSEGLGHIPVILLTASSSAEAQLKGIEGGADDYITKPFDAQLLLARVNSILKNRNALQRYFFDKITLQDSAVKVPAEYRDFLKQCIHLVEDNIETENFTIQQFARAMGMSRSALYNKVKHISGQSLNAFVRSIRLRRAAVLMIRERMNVNQAAFQVGIGDVRYFREQFVKLFGMTPSEYIKKYRQSFNGDLNLLKSDQ